ncbi:MAG: hypothetical protein F4092_08170 [Rhodospirillaceae bacterium]|nr:hypothetical protein [Rhodospirillaceae bacterium]MYJ71728.1 hypothetical protein [Rhodospirillaceae bacterium]
MIDDRDDRQENDLTEGERRVMALLGRCFLSQASRADTAAERTERMRLAGRALEVANGAP